MNKITSQRGRNRRGFAVASVVVLLLMLNMVAFGTIDGARDDGRAAALRVETLRALYAAESGVLIAAGEINAGYDAPAAGTTIELESAKAEFISVMDGQPSIVVEGRAGFGRRRLVVEVADGN